MDKAPDAFRTISEVAQELDVHPAEAATILRHLSLAGNSRRVEGVDDEARNRALEQQLAARGDELAQERARAQMLEQQLAAREDEQKLLAQERARNRALEQQLAARRDDQKLLAQERARNPAPELQLVVRRDAVQDRDRTGTASPSDRPASRQAPPAPDKSATTVPPASDKPVMRANHKLQRLTARPTAPEAPGNLEAARLMAEARLLLDQGNISAARSVLERAAKSGSALALFLLAETYDRAILSAWGISGRRGNVRKARELYAKAVAGGVHEAEDRLSALRQRRANRGGLVPA